MKKTSDINKGRLLGAHCSSSGGVASALERAGRLRCSAVSLFTKSSNQWKAPALAAAEIDSFRDALLSNNIGFVAAHVGYLINLATVDPAVHEDSMASMRIELERAVALEIPCLVAHPGSHKEAGELAGILQIVENLRRLMDEFKYAKVQIVLETTSGQGSSIGYDFGHFAEIFDRLDWPANLGLCVDTAHIFGAGYDISTKEGYEATFRELDEVVGLDYVRIFHLNDTKTPCGSRVDRHEHIGKGKIGIEAFRLLLNDRRFTRLPMVIETPKDSTLEQDRENLNVLRGLIKE